MNYNKIYNDMIENAKTKIRSKKDGNYYEIHHIIPVCMNGTNDKDNLVLLTAREHFMAHKLLHKIYPKNYKLYFAFVSMCKFLTDNRYKPCSRDFDYLKESFGRYISEINTGRQHTEETKQKMRDNNPNRGGLREEHKQAISEALTGRKLSEEHIESCSKGLRKYYETHPGTQTGRTKSPEEIEAQRIALIEYWETRTPEQMKEWSEKFSGENNANYGKPRTDEVKQAISEKNSVKVLFDGILYDSFSIAQNELNMTRKVMKRILDKEISKNNANYKIFYKEGSKIIGRKNPDKQKKILFDGVVYNSLKECGEKINKSDVRVGQILREQIKNGNDNYKYLT